MRIKARFRTLLTASCLVAGMLTGVSVLAPAAEAEALGSSTANEVALDAPIVGANYHWRNDIQAQVMAQHIGPVLHRVGGSWFNAPDIPQESRSVEGTGKSLFGPGTPLFIGDKMCTLAVAGYDNAGRKVGLTAGHCGGLGAQVYSADSPGVGPAGVITNAAPGLDFAVISFNDSAEVSRSYDGVTLNAVGGSPAFGQQVCKKGVATGFTCGIAWDTYNSQVCAMQGDSGGPLLAGDRLLGVISGGNPIVPVSSCNTPWQGPVHMPTISAPIDAILAQLDASGGPGAGFRLP